MKVMVKETSLSNKIYLDRIKLFLKYIMNNPKKTLINRIFKNESWWIIHKFSPVDKNLKSYNKLYQYT